MKEHRNFWDRNAAIYDRFMHKDSGAYAQMYDLLRPVVRHKTVLELATGTGLIAKHIVSAAEHIEATDASEEMIAEAQRENYSAKLHFSVQDMFHLPYADQAFDVVIVSNALHIVPQPETALREIRRVLKRSFRRDQIVFHEAGGLPAAQQVDQRGVSDFSAGKRLDGAEERRTEGVLPADIRGMRENGRSGIV